VSEYCVLCNVLNNEMRRTYVTFGDDDVDDTAYDRDEIKHVPRITKVILYQQTNRIRSTISYLWPIKLILTARSTPAHLVLSYFIFSKHLLK